MSGSPVDRINSLLKLSGVTVTVFVGDYRDVCASQGVEHGLPSTLLPGKLLSLVTSDVLAVMASTSGSESDSDSIESGVTITVGV